jgi:hypothetical protein
LDAFMGLYAIFSGGRWLTGGLGFRRLRYCRECGALVYRRSRLLLLRAVTGYRVG